jgi:Camelysin metallo-endopeptidase
MNKLPRKRLVAIITAALLLTGGGIAFAYWSAGGSGTGSATTGTTVPITANQTSSVTNMRPGDSAQTLSGTFTNTNTGPVYVTSVVASISSVDKAVGAPAGTCDATDYTLANATMTVNAEVASGTGVGAWTGATIKFNDKAATNQDGCKGATVNLAYVVN